MNRMDSYIILAISEDDATPHPTCQELLRIYNTLDYDGMVNVMATAYQEKARMSGIKFVDKKE